MRDDVATLFEALAQLQKEKIGLLEQLFRYNQEKRNLIKIGSPELSVQYLERETSSMQRIDCIDADIARIKKTIADCCGIQEIDFNKTFSSIDHHRTQEYFKNETHIMELQHKTLKENAAALHELERETVKTRKDIDEIRRMIQLSGKIRNPS